jgi:transcriptional regulator with XRE-family HTH domain
MGSNFRENLRDELDYQDLTVKELSSRTMIPKATLDCYLGARSSLPTVDVAVKIATVLGVTVEYLVTGEQKDQEPNAVREMLKYMKFRDMFADLEILPKSLLFPIRAMIKAAASEERKKRN